MEKTARKFKGLERGMMMIMKMFGLKNFLIEFMTISKTIELLQGKQLVSE